MDAYGLDIGGSGIKGAPGRPRHGGTHGRAGEDRHSKPATPEAIVETAAEVISRSGWEGPVGCGFPAVIKDGVAQTAANIEDAAIGFDFKKNLEGALGCSVSLVNDADAAGPRRDALGAPGARSKAWC